MKSHVKRPMLKVLDLVTYWPSGVKVSEWIMVIASQIHLHSILCMVLTFLNTISLRIPSFLNFLGFNFFLVFSLFIFVNSQVISILIGFTVCLLHSHRCILFRRVFFIAGLMYFYRAVTMSGGMMNMGITRV